MSGKSNEMSKLSACTFRHKQQQIRIYMARPCTLSLGHINFSRMTTILGTFHLPAMKLQWKLYKANKLKLSLDK